MPALVLPVVPVMSEDVYWVEQNQLKRKVTVVDMVPVVVSEIVAALLVQTLAFADAF